MWRAGFRTEWTEIESRGALDSLSVCLTARAKAATCPLHSSAVACERMLQSKELLVSKLQARASGWG